MNILKAAENLAEELDQNEEFKVILDKNINKETGDDNIIKEQGISKFNGISEEEDDIEQDFFNKKPEQIIVEGKTTQDNQIYFKEETDFLNLTQRKAKYFSKRIFGVTYYTKNNFTFNYKLPINGDQNSNIQIKKSNINFPHQSKLEAVFNLNYKEIQRPQIATVGFNLISQKNKGETYLICKIPEKSFSIYQKYLREMKYVSFGMESTYSFDNHTFPNFLYGVKLTPFSSFMINFTHNIKYQEPNMSHFLGLGVSYKLNEQNSFFLKSIYDQNDETVKLTAGGTSKANDNFALNMSINQKFQVFAQSSIKLKENITLNVDSTINLQQGLQPFNYKFGLKIEI